jgi:hypothetical protein
MSDRDVTVSTSACTMVAEQGESCSRTPMLRWAVAVGPRSSCSSRNLTYGYIGGVLPPWPCLIPAKGDF